MNRLTSKEMVDVFRQLGLRPPCSTILSYLITQAGQKKGVEEIMRATGLPQPVVSTCTLAMTDYIDYVLNDSPRRGRRMKYYSIRPINEVKTLMMAKVNAKQMNVLGMKAAIEAL